MKVNGYEIKARTDLSGANLSEAYLRGANLSEANLSEANLSGTDLCEADLCEADLGRANLRGADLSGANLSGTNLRGANLSEANLSEAYLCEADLGRANLSGTDLSGANLSGTNLRGADLSGANLSGTDLSGVVGLLDAKEWLDKNFKTNKKGYIVYKAEGDSYYPPPERWAKSQFITEVVNPNRVDTCGCGVNFATLKWIKNNFRSERIRIRRMYLHWKDLVDVVVPYNTDGKARCGRLEKGKLIKT